MGNPKRGGQGWGSAQEHKVRALKCCCCIRILAVRVKFEHRSLFSDLPLLTSPAHTGILNFHSQIHALRNIPSIPRSRYYYQPYQLACLNGVI